MTTNCDSIYLRALKPSDLEQLEQLSEETTFPFRAVPLSKISEPLSGFSGPDQSASVQSDETLLSFAIMKHDHLVGQLTMWGIDFLKGHCTVTMGIAAKANRHRGIGTCALIMGLRYAFYSLGLQKVTTDTLSTNQAARRCLNKVGFIQTGTEQRVFPLDKDFIDRLHYQMQRSDFDRLYHFPREK
ncbi:Acetyltransferase (GNAT) domain protein [anaerobic digester metagenome]